MFRGSRPLTLQQAQTYYTREYARGDYYTGAAGAREAGDAPGTWRGAAAADLGLEGPVDRQHFQDLLGGHLGDKRLVAPATATGVHRAAWDFQVAPDKTVSLVALVGGDHRVVAAHHAAADRAFAVFERHAQTRDRTRQLVSTGSLLAARFDHDASRALDPQLHSHHVVFNLTRRPDGAWRALESRSLFRVQPLATATYHLELARELERLGYAVRINPRGHVAIAGIPERAVRHFSKRRREILAELDRQQGPRDAQRAAIKTRRPKDHGVDREALRRTWAAAADDLGVDLADLRRQAALRLEAGAGRPAAHPADPAAQASESATWAIDHLSERQAVFTLRELETAALRHATGRGPAADQVRAALATHPDRVAGAGDRLTTARALRLEAGNLDLMRQARDARRPPIVAAPWHDPGLAADQLRVARHILENQAQILAVEGKPGTGKTFTLSRVRDVAASRGWTVRGFAVTTGAVEELRKVGLESATVKSLERRTRGAPDASAALSAPSGAVGPAVPTVRSGLGPPAIPATTPTAPGITLGFGAPAGPSRIVAPGIASGLDAPARPSHTAAPGVPSGLGPPGGTSGSAAPAAAPAPLGLAAAPFPPTVRAHPAATLPRELWIVDEAGLLGNRDARTVLAQAQTAGARLVLVGDRRQHHAVAAGKPFVDLQRAGLQAARLDTIRRQRQPDLLAAVRLTSEGRAAEAVHLLARHGRVTQIAAAPDRHLAIARAFLEAPRDTLMIAPSHAERAALNDLARRLLVAHGRVAAGGLDVEVAVSKNLTGAERTDLRNYRPGDLVTFHRGSPARRLRAGDTARVLAVDPDRHLVTIRHPRPSAGAATTLDYDPRRLRGVDVARVERRQLAAGDRIVFRQPHRSPGNPGAPGAPAIANGAAATVSRVDPAGTLEIRLDRRPGLPIVLDGRAAPLPIDHGYAVTSHAAQGRTVHTVLAAVDTNHAAELVNRQQLNVTVSRASHGLHLFTDNAAALPAAVDREAPKTSALDLQRHPRSPHRALDQGPDLTPAAIAGNPPAPRHAAAARRGDRQRPSSEASRASGAHGSARAAGDNRAVSVDRPTGTVRAAGDDRAVRVDRPAFAARTATGRPDPAVDPGRPAAGGVRPPQRRRADRPLLARAAGQDRRPPPELQPRRRPLRPPDPPRDPGRAAPGGARGSGRRRPGNPPHPRRAVAQDRLPRRPASPLPARLRERLETAWGRWQAWSAERDSLARQGQALHVEIARLRAVAPPGPAAPSPAVRSLLGRLATVTSHLAALTRARSPEELLARTVRQIGVARAISLLPPAAGAVIQTLRLGTRLLTSLVRDR
jgi:conjugative relaxase-like TrwC/TraI family protein